MEKSTYKLLNKLFSTCGLPEDPPEPIGASFFPVGLSDIPLAQRAKMEQTASNKMAIQTTTVIKDKKQMNDMDSRTFKCSRCGKDNITFHDMSKDSSSSKGIKTYCKKCASEVEIVKEKERRDSRIIVDFRKIKDGMEMMEIIKKRAEDNCRTPSAEIIFLLKSTGLLSCSEK